LAYKENKPFAFSFIRKLLTFSHSYNSSVSDAFKINSLPEIDDSVTVTPSFNYFMLPVRMDIEYEPKEIKPAKMTIPLSKLYKSYLKLGLGNYFTPLAEYSYNGLRSEDHAI